jgi:hypothetical protein
VLALKPQQEDALFGRALALKAGNQLAAAKAAFEQLVGSGNGSRAKDARAQIASIELRLAQAKPAAESARAGSGSAR